MHLPIAHLTDHLIVHRIRHMIGKYTVYKIHVDLSYLRMSEIKRKEM